MRGDRRLSLVVGAFALGSLVVFGAVVLSLTAQRGFWTPRYHLIAYFDNVEGLVEGAPVRLAGKDVGSVATVSFGPLGGGNPPVRVDLLVDSAVRERIRTDSQATIGTIGLLGDKYVEVTMGTLEGQVLADGDELRSITPLALADVVGKGAAALDSVAELAENVNTAVTEFRGEVGAARIAEAALAVSDLAREVRYGHGLLHGLIYEPYEGEGVETLGRSLSTLESILHEIASGDGVLHQMIYAPPGEGDLVVQTLEAGARLNSVLAKIDSGQGTLGLLLTDPTLYEDLKTLVGGAQRSLVVRSLIDLSRSDAN
jgi:phospholipid/cholesterol/gamma-HCH transport system substrate-binding protein